MNTGDKDTTMQSALFSLISMLDEPDAVLYEKIFQSIVRMGAPALALLEEARENTLETFMGEKLEELIRTIHTDVILEDLVSWKSSATLDILQLMQLLCRFHYRNLDTIRLNERVTSMQKAIWLEINEDLTSLECVRLVNHFVFRTWEFKSDTANLLEAGIFFLNKVIDNKTAHPATLGALYLGLCQRLSLPVYYVALPENFILVYTGQKAFNSNIEPAEVLFYINPLLEGVIFNRNEIERFLNNHEIQTKPHYFEPSGNLRVASLILREMQKIYQGTGDQGRISSVNRLLRFIEERPE